MVGVGTVGAVVSITLGPIGKGGRALVIGGGKVLSGCSAIGFSVVGIGNGITGGLGLG